MKKDISYWTIWFLILTITYCHFRNPSLKNGYFTHELSWDVTAYYWYLPITFIYHDVKMKNHEIVDKLYEKYKMSPSQYQIFKTHNGNWTMYTSGGLAMLWAPFFFIGHLWALHSNYPPDGFSFPYQFSITNGVLIYIFLGLFFIRKVLLNYLSSTITALSLLFFVLGTNYFEQAYNGSLQPHPVLFTAYAILLYITIKWHRTFERKYLVAGGLLIGFMILARPSDILCLLIPLLWNVYDKDSLREKIDILKQKGKQIFYFIFCLFIPFIPQVIYWKIVTGSWFFYSYQHTEKLDFESPYFLKVLFSFNAGLLIYWPILGFSIVGIFLLWKYNRSIFFSIAIFLAANFYLLASYPGWWNVRYYVQSYAVLVIPFGYVLHDIGKRKFLLRAAIGIIMSFFLFMGLFHAWQFAYYVLPFQRVNFEYYKRVFLKTQVRPEDVKYMGVERSFNSEIFTNQRDYNKFTIAYYNFDSINSTIIEPNRLDSSHYISAPYSYKLGPDDEYGLTYKIRYDQLVKPDKDHVWLHISLNYFSDIDVKDNLTYVVFEMPHKKYNYNYHTVDFTKFTSLSGKWNQIQYDYLTPLPYSEKDYIYVYLMHHGKHDIYFDNVQIDAFERKPINELKD